LVSIPPCQGTGTRRWRVGLVSLAWRPSLRTDPSRPDSRSLPVPSSWPKTKLLNTLRNLLSSLSQPAGSPEQDGVRPSNGQSEEKRKSPKPTYCSAVKERTMHSYLFGISAAVRGLAMVSTVEAGHGRSSSGGSSSSHSMSSSYSSSRMSSVRSSQIYSNSNRIHNTNYSSTNFKKFDSHKMTSY